MAERAAKAFFWLMAAGLFGTFVLMATDCDAHNGPHPCVAGGYCRTGMCQRIHHSRFGANHHLPPARMAGQGIAKGVAAGLGASVAYDPSPTPPEAVALMVHLANIQPDTVCVDPGCGADARLLIAACRAGAAKGIGFEIDPQRAEQARQAVQAANLADHVTIWCMDSRQAIMPKRAVFLVYLFPEMLEDLGGAFDQGERVVSYHFDLPGRLTSGTQTAKGKQWVYVWESQ